MYGLSPGLIRAVEHLVQDLAQKKYREIVADGRGGRLSVDGLENAIDAYGRTVVPLPIEAWELVDVYPIVGRPGMLSMDVPLWTREEGRSDLTLSLTAETSGEDVRVEIDDLHVL